MIELGIVVRVYRFDVVRLDVVRSDVVRLGVMRFEVAVRDGVGMIVVCFVDVLGGEHRRQHQARCDG